MSVLAGFDFCLELTGDYLVGWMGNALRTTTDSLAVPFTRESPTDTGAAGPSRGAPPAKEDSQARLTVTSLTGSITLDAHFVLTLQYECGEAFSRVGGPSWMKGNQGKLKITVPLTLEHDPASNTASLIAHTAAADRFKVEPEPKSDPFAALAASDIAADLGKEPIRQVIPNVPVMPGQDGTLQPNLQLECLEMAAVQFGSGPVRLCLFGNVFAATEVSAAPKAKTSFALADADEGYALSISERLVRAMMCPTLTDQLVNRSKGASGRGDMPPVCGSGTGIAVPADDKNNVPGYLITSLVPVLSDGAILIVTAATVTGTCYTAETTLIVIATPSIDPSTGELTVSQQVSPPDVEISMHFWCKMALLVGDVIVFGLGPSLYAVIAEAIIGDVGISVAQGGVAGEVQTSVQQDLDHMDQVLVPVNVFGLTWGSVEVTPERLTLLQRLIDPEHPTGVRTGQDAVPRMALTTVLETVDKPVLASPTNPDPICHSTSCPVGDFPYQEYQQTYKLTAHLRPWLACRPYQSEEWFIYGSDGDHPLAPGKGSVRFQVDAYHPIDAGGNLSQIPLPQQVTLQYELDDGGLTIARTNPADGWYSLDVHVSVVDAHGAGPLNAWASLTIMGEHVDIGGDYDYKLQICQAGFGQALQHLQGFQSFGAIPRGGDPDPRFVVAGQPLAQIALGGDPGSWELASKVARQPSQAIRVTTSSAFRLANRLPAELRRSKR